MLMMSLFLILLKFLHICYVICKKKITVAISGEGADELFGGYPRYKNIALFGIKLKNNLKFFLN